MPLKKPRQGQADQVSGSKAEEEEKRRSSARKSRGSKALHQGVDSRRVWIRQDSQDDPRMADDVMDRSSIYGRLYGGMTRSTRNATRESERETPYSL